MRHLVNTLWAVAVLGGFFAANTGTAAAQTPEPTAAQQRIAFRVGLGPTAFSGMEGGPVGAHGSVAITARPAGSRFALTAELLHERFAAQPLYPCILVVGERCVDSSERSVTAGVLSGSFYFTREREATDLTPALYLIAGGGFYDSRREATVAPRSGFARGKGSSLHSTTPALA